MTVEEELEAIEIDWTLGVAENFQRVKSAALAALEAANKLAEEAEAKLNSPELHDFSAGVIMEAAHQRERWGSEHDESKGADDWFWLIAYLATKAMQAITYGDHDKALHHMITTAAALANWHASLTGKNTEMRPCVPEGKVKTWRCRHEPYQGRCAHCDVPFINGLPSSPEGAGQ
jgi:hypothetical protein